MLPHRRHPATRKPEKTAPAAAEKLRNEKIRFYDLQHSFATLAIQNGVDVKTLSGLLGHYSAGFTLDTYGHIYTQMQQDAAQKVGGFLRMNM